MRKFSFLIFSVILFIHCHAVAGNNVVELVKKTKPAVVLIETFSENYEQIAQGSGFFINESGHLVTNYHVIESASFVIAKTADGKSYSVDKIITSDESIDIVILLANLNGDTVNFLEFAKEKPSAGEDIIVVGNPLGLESTITTGIVSAVREISGLANVLQITAPISSGSSGSPVINMEGKVVGVATLILTEGQALNFAISCDTILNLTKKRKTVNSLKDYTETAGKESKETTKLYRTGISKVLEGKYQEAIGYFERILKEFPDHDGTHYYLGVTYGALGRYEEAAKSFEAAISINPERENCHYFLGIAYFELEFYNKAIDAHKQAVSINPEDVDASHYLVLSYLAIGDTDSADKEFEILKLLDKERATKLKQRFEELLSKYSSDIDSKSNTQNLSNDLTQKHSPQKRVKKALNLIDIDQFTEDTQISAPCDDGHVNAIWWIPIEFWQVVFLKDNTISKSEIRDFLNVVRKYSILAIVQADVGDYGSFRYYSKEDVRKNLDITLKTKNKSIKRLIAMKEKDVDSTLNLMIEIMKPVFTNAMGNLGENLHFFVLEAYDSAGARIIDPYSFGTLRFRLGKSNGDLIEGYLDLPLDSLYIPRKCPNGKDAHVTWEYCPWTGKKLED